MKRHMQKWGTLFSVLGILSIIVGVGSVALLARAGEGVGIIISGIMMLMFSSACNWMDDVTEGLESINETLKTQRGFASNAERDTQRLLKELTDVVKDIKAISISSMSGRGYSPEERTTDTRWQEENTRADSPRRAARRTYAEDRVQPPQTEEEEFVPPPPIDVAAALKYANELNRK